MGGRAQGQSCSANGGNRYDLSGLWGFWVGRQCEGFSEAWRQNVELAPDRIPGGDALAAGAQGLRGKWWFLFGKCHSYSHSNHRSHLYSSCRPHPYPDCSAFADAYLCSPVHDRPSLSRQQPHSQSASHCPQRGLEMAADHCRGPARFAPHLYSGRRMQSGISQHAAQFPH
jgi:hypothetical protein